MEVKVAKGKYVIAVSGGVDSMVLLDLLTRKPDIEVIVAHFNHGIREDSIKEEAFVKAAAADYGVPFAVGYGELGPRASEEAARNARYRFLEGIKRKTGAAAVITAHHQDDLIETAFINIIRGTGRRGLVAMKMNHKVVRPLLDYKKQDILKYAKQHHLTWLEDQSNSDDAYLRNRLRHRATPNLSDQQRQQLICNIDKVAKIEKMISPQIAKISQKITTKGYIDRRSFTALPIDLADELILFWLRQQNARPDKKRVKKLNVVLRASKGGTEYRVSSGLCLVVADDSARFVYTL